MSLFDHTDMRSLAAGELEIEAAVANLPQVLAFIEQHLEQADCPVKTQMQISLAAEEIFINIARYAYAPQQGMVTVRVDVSADPVTATLTFIDQGVPYDPLAKEDPDVTLSADEREIGGLGIFITKRTMDEVAYEYRDGRNILTMKKRL